MRRHRKKISLLTLTVFLLVTMLASPAMTFAAKAPAEKPAISKPDTLSSSNKKGITDAGVEALNKALLKNTTNGSGETIFDFAVFGAGDNANGNTTGIGHNVTILGGLLGGNRKVVIRGGSNVVGVRSGAETYIGNDAGGEDEDEGSLGLTKGIIANGKVTLTRKSEVLGNVDGSEIRVGDTASVQGNVVVSGKLEMVSKAAITGDADAGSASLGANTSISGTLTLPVGVEPTGTGINQGTAYIGAIVNGTPQIPKTFSKITLPEPLSYTASSSNTDDVTVANGGTLTLAPGTYRDLELKQDATLSISSGTYIFRHISSSARASINVDASSGPVTILAAGNVSFGQNLAVTVNGGTAKDVYLETAGTFSTGVNSTWKGTVYSTKSNSPGSNGISIGHDNTITGALYSRQQVNIAGGSTVIFELADVFYGEPAPVVWNVSIVPDSLLLTAGGRTDVLAAIIDPAPQEPDSPEVQWAIEGAPAGVQPLQPSGDNNRYCTVDPEQLEAGDYVIKAWITPGNESTCNVTVVKPIEVRVTKGPKLKQNGIYEATFGYKCYYPDGVYIPLGDDNKFMGENGEGEIVGDIPTTFVYSPDDFTEAFTVRYYHSHGTQTWTVTYDGVSSSDRAGTGEDPAITVSPDPLDVIVGGQGTLTATVSSGDIVPPPNRLMNLVSDITWDIIEGEGLISLSKNRGKAIQITGHYSGVATVQATFSSGYTATGKVRVWDIGLDINNLPDMPMTAGGNTRKIYAVIEPAGEEHDWTVTWQTDDTAGSVISIATGSDNLEGVITPIAAGSAQVWAELDVSGTKIISEKYTVNVVDPIELVVIGEPVLKAKGVYEAKLGYKSFYPETVIADDSAIAAFYGGVYENGVDYRIIGMSQPPATFRSGPAVPGEYYEAFTVRYYHNKPITWVVEYDGVVSDVTPGIGSDPDVDIRPASLNLVVGGPDGMLRAKVDPGEIVPPPLMILSALPSDITWTIIDGNDVIGIPENARGRTCLVTPLSAGTAVVRAIFADTYESEDYTVTVWDINLDTENLPLMPMTAGGNIRNIYAVIDPAGEEHDWTVTWKTDDTAGSVISIATGADDLEGVITPVAAGSAQVWAEMIVDGQLVATESFTVTVVDPLELKIKVAPQPLNEDGTYEVTFGYVSHYPGEVFTKDSWIMGNYELMDDNEILHTFYPESDGTFTVRYFHGERPLTWYVTYDGITSEVSTGAIEEEDGGELDDKDIGISVNPVDLIMDAWSDTQQLKAAVIDLNKVLFSVVNRVEYHGINWTFQVKDGEGWADGVGNVIGYDTDEGTTVNIQPRDPGQVKATASFNGVSDSCIITVNDPRTITLAPTSLALRRNRDPGTVTATINGIPTIPEGEESLYDWEQVYWNTSSSAIAGITAVGNTCTVNPLGSGSATITASLENGKTAACSVRVSSRNVSQSESGGPAPAALPETPAPPALETLNVTFTIGNTMALVNGEQAILDTAPLLFADRAMVSYSDMAKLIPGVEVVWDWKTLTVNFTKDEKSLSMVLDQVPEGFDTPFMNIGGQLMVPARFVGNFFGAVVDWIGDTLVVQMTK